MRTMFPQPPAIKTIGYASHNELLNLIQMNLKKLPKA